VPLVNNVYSEIINNLFCVAEEEEVLLTAYTDRMIPYNSVSEPPGPGINYTGPSSYKERIYRAAVSQRLRTTAL
jgi:hypothetical protein